MSYIINKTDGTVLTEIVDGTIDQTATDLTLIGKNSSSYGEVMNENFIHLLENFANTSQPNNPIHGQLWYDTTENRLKVYNGTQFVVSGGTIVSNNIPILTQGDLWIDSRRKQLFFNDGVSTILAGPAWTVQQGVTGFAVADILDIDNNSRTIATLTIGGVPLGIFSNTQFAPNIDNDSLAGWEGQEFSLTTTYIKGDRVNYRSNPNTPPKLVYQAIADVIPPGTLPTNTSYWKQIKLNPGFNAGTLGNLKFDVISTSADALIDSSGNLYAAEDFILSQGDSTITGQLTIANSQPLVLGASSQTEIRVGNSSFEINSNISDQNFQIGSKNVSAGVQASIFVNANAERVGIYTSNPGLDLDPSWKGLDVKENVRIRGDLVVEGTTTTISSEELIVSDINITIASGATTDIYTSPPGITINGATDKTFQWNAGAWTSSENINVLSGKGYYINEVEILNYTSLSTTVTDAQGVKRLGILDSVQIDGEMASGLKIDGNTISYYFPGASSGDIVLLPKNIGNVNVSSRKIVNLANPQSDTDAANKTYVDIELRSMTLAFSADTASYAGPSLNANIAANIIEKILPATEHENGTYCRFWCIDLYQAKLFRVNAGVWGWDSDIP